jgi:hypothetical protein
VSRKARPPAIDALEDRQYFGRLNLGNGTLAKPKKRVILKTRQRLFILANLN